MTGQRLRVTMPDGTEDGDTFEVVAYNPDQLRYERTAMKHGWGVGDKSPMFHFVTFLAWSAAKRSQKIPADMTWETFADACLEVADADDTDDDSEDGADPERPTRPVPNTG